MKARWTGVGGTGLGNLIFAGGLYGPNSIIEVTEAELDIMPDSTSAALILETEEGFNSNDLAAAIAMEEPETEAVGGKDYTAMSRQELLKFASEVGIEVNFKMTKAELIQSLNELEG